MGPNSNDNNISVITEQSEIFLNPKTKTKYCSEIWVVVNLNFL